MRSQGQGLIEADPDVHWLRVFGLQTHLTVLRRLTDCQEAWIGLMQQGWPFSYSCDGGLAVTGPGREKQERTRTWDRFARA